MKEKIAMILKKGAEIRHEQLELFRKMIPPVKEIILENSLDLEKWFHFYQKLLCFGVHQISKVDIADELMEIYHHSYVKCKKEQFRVVLPRRIQLTDDFCYFLGLWCGDRTGGGRVGVVNKEKQLNEFTAYYIRELHQKPQVVVLKSSRISELPPLDIKFDAIQEFKNMAGTYVPMVFAVNGILKQFFFYLDQQLDEFLDLLPNKNAFFAGLFDAEGNVFLEDSCFRWACKDLRKVRIYKKHLLGMDLFRRYDGGNLVCSNKESFCKLILPYLKHPQKVNDTNLVGYGIGELNNRFLSILQAVKANDGSEMKNLAKALKKVRLDAQIRFLEKLNYVTRKNYPKMVFITEKGLASLSQGGKDR